MRNIAICITLGENAENHVGMQKIGDGELARSGFSCDELSRIKDEYEELGGVAELYDLRTLSGVDDVPEANVLILRDSTVFLCDRDADKILGELAGLEWDKKYWDQRRQKVLNKNARHNLCFAEQGNEPDYGNKKGRVVAFADVPLMASWKSRVEKLCDQPPLAAEGNLYYDARKCGIGWHGDGERKKVIALSLCSPDVTREIQWRWYLRSEPISDRIVVQLGNGDGYIMSEKASGFDWKKSSIYTLRHAAAVPGSKYLQ
jgi:hypothetical protein